MRKVWHGRVQRRLLEELSRNLHDPVEDEREIDTSGHYRLTRGRSWTRLSDMIAADASVAEYESARRALHRLAEVGLVELGRSNYMVAGKQHRCLVVRLTPTPEQEQEMEEIRAMKRLKWTARREQTQRVFARYDGDSI